MFLPFVTALIIVAKLSSVNIMAAASFATSVPVIPMAAFYIGNGKGAAMASTMAFATLTLARLFHGFNCRGNKTIFALGFTGNPYSILAFVSGSVLLGLVLFVPPLRGLFSVESLSCPAVIEIILLAALPTVVIQMVRGVRELKK